MTQISDDLFQRAMFDAVDAGKEQAVKSVRAELLAEIPESGDFATLININGVIHWWRGDSVARLKSMQ